jgi:hypothetical protein
VDLAAAAAAVTPSSLADGMVKLVSRRYPFCATGGRCDNSIRSAMTLVPFNPELNRFRLVISATAANYAVTQTRPASTRRATAQA